MDTEVKNVSEDAEMADCDGEKVVTMMDVLQQQEEFEEDVNAVLGASDEKECTYAKGYIKRQAIYACTTCCSDAKNDLSKRAGICLACSLTCHENHDLIELYTKRNFKCDCGNPKFNSHPCNFTPDKTDLNEDNNYNQNFSGLYCICQRPYPDPESETEVEMIQCIICEDWLHAPHLEATVPDNDQYSEMICKNCMEKNEFLHDYGEFAVNIDVDVVTNGIDNDKMCNGDAKLEICVGDEATKPDDAEIKEKDLNSDNDTIKESTEDGKSCDAKDSSDEKKDEKISLETPMETEESETNPNNPTEIATENVTKDNVPDETFATDKAVDNERTKERTEVATELENTESVEISAEQLEEEKLLEDPDENKKLNAEDDVNKDGSNVQNSELPQVDDTKSSENAVNDTKSSETPVNDTSDTTETNENVAARENKPKSDDEQEESKNDKSSTEVPEKSEENLTVDVKDNLEENETVGDDSETVEPKESVLQNGDVEVKTIEKRKLSTEDDTDSESKKVKLEEVVKCTRPKGVKKIHKGATFWPSSFRQKLCTCGECITMYTDLAVLFLIDPEDTVTAYENLGKEKIHGNPSQYEKGLQALSSLDRIQQINALTEYNKMRDKLLDFLKSFKDRREVVKEEDIKAFFAGMKPKREPDGVYFCR